MNKIYIKTDSLNRLDLLETAGLVVTEVQELTLDESSQIDNVVAITLELPDGWVVTATVKGKEVVPDLTSAKDKDGYHTKIEFHVLDTLGRERVRTGFCTPYRNHSFLSITPEWDIHNQVFKWDENGGSTQLPPQLAHWGEIIRNATPDEIREHNGSWTKINRYSSC